MPKPITEAEWCKWLARVVFDRSPPFTFWPEHNEPVPFDPFRYAEACRLLEEQTLKEGLHLSVDWYKDIQKYEARVFSRSRHALLGTACESLLNETRTYAMAEAWWAMKGENDA